VGTALEGRTANMEKNREKKVKKDVDPPGCVLVQIRACAIHTDRE
jgi:hypothetical protein